MRTPRPSRLTAAGLALLIATGCGSASAPSAPSSNPPASASMPARSASATPSSSASPSASSAGLASGAPSADVTMDPSLLQLLPATIASARVELEPASFAEAVRDPTFVASVDAAAFAIVAEGEDLASGVVAHLRPGVYSEAFFRDWRDSYDDGACAQAGGVVARAQVSIGVGRTMEVTTCAEGLRVYHAYLADREVVVSLISLGARRFGEQLMTGLRP